MVLRMPRRRRGAAAVEFAVVLPFLLALLFGLWEVGRMLEVQQILINAAREGGRHASLGKTDAEVAQVVRNYLRDAGIPTTNVSIPPLTRTVEASGETSVRVQVSLPLQDVRWINLYLVTNASTTLTADSVWPGP